MRVIIGCPQCGSHDACRSTRRSFFEWFLKRLLVLPYRCLNCDVRFFRSSLIHRRAAH